MDIELQEKKKPSKEEQRDNYYESNIDESTLSVTTPFESDQVQLLEKVVVKVDSLGCKNKGFVKDDSGSTASSTLSAGDDDEDGQSSVLRKRPANLVLGVQETQQNEVEDTTSDISETHQPDVEEPEQINRTSVYRSLTTRSDADRVERPRKNVCCERISLTFGFFIFAFCLLYSEKDAVYYMYQRIKNKIFSS